MSKPTIMYKLEKKKRNEKMNTCYGNYVPTGVGHTLDTPKKLGVGTPN